MSCSFDLGHYASCSRRRRPAATGSRRFGEAPAPGDLFLRHDVDLSLDAAVRMAELEVEHGVQTTYLLMTESVFYNLASREGAAAIARLRELGHAVGLHAVYPNVELDDRFDPVVSWHNPRPEYMSDEIAGAVNAYGRAVLRRRRRTGRTRTSTGDPAARTRSCAAVHSHGCRSSSTRRSGCTRERRWARRCAQWSRPRRRAGSSSSQLTESTLADEVRCASSIAR